MNVFCQKTSLCPSLCLFPLYFLEWIFTSFHVIESEIRSWGGNNIFNVIQLQRTEILCLITLFPNKLRESLLYVPSLIYQKMAVLLLSSEPGGFDTSKYQSRIFPWKKYNKEGAFSMFIWTDWDSLCAGATNPFKM